MGKYWVFLFLLVPLQALAGPACHVVPLPQVTTAPVTQAGLSVDGYVNYVSTCAVCQAGQPCDDCVEPYFIISTHKMTPVTSGAVDHDELILASRAGLSNRLQVGQLYRFQLATDSDPTWKFTGQFSDSYSRRLFALTAEPDPTPCSEH
ncbi:MAG: hypothetical protein M3N08_00120 [Pseudomonadota bacterium]|nr:hypothetical protein [Pseudomonadota bacterium]